MCCNVLQSLRTTAGTTVSMDAIYVSHPTQTIVSNFPHDTCGSSALCTIFSPTLHIQCYILSHPTHTKLYILTPYTQSARQTALAFLFSFWQIQSYTPYTYNHATYSHTLRIRQCDVWWNRQGRPRYMNFAHPTQIMLHMLSHIHILTPYTFDSVSVIQSARQNSR